MVDRYITGIERIFEVKRCARSVKKVFFDEMLCKYEKKLFFKNDRLLLDELRLLGTTFAGETELFKQGCSKKLYSLIRKLEKEFDYQKYSILLSEDKESLPNLLKKFEEYIVQVKIFLDHLGPMRDISNSKERVFFLLPILEQLLQLCEACENQNRDIFKILDKNKVYNWSLSLDILQHASSISDYKIAIAYLVPIVELSFFPLRETKEDYFTETKASDIELAFYLGYRTLKTETSCLDKYVVAFKKIAAILDLYKNKWRQTEVFEDAVEEMREEIKEEYRDLVRFTKIYMDGVNYLYEKFKLERRCQHSLDHPVVTGILRGALCLLVLYFEGLPLFKDHEEEKPVVVKKKVSEEELKLRSILRKLSTNSRGMRPNQDIFRRVQFQMFV